MITIKSAEEIELMRQANRIVRDCLDMLGARLRVGMTTKQIDRLAHDFIVARGAVPSFLGYGGFPASVCVSINEQVVHGIPSDKRIVQDGDLVSIDCGAIWRGYNGDAARSYLVGAASDEKKRLVEATERCFFQGVGVLKEGCRLGDLGNAIQTYAENAGYGVVRELVGHGIGRDMHEDPEVPNYGRAGHGLRLKAGMTIAVEPMINAGCKEVYVEDDGWTVVTRDGRPSAHYENTVVITEDGAEILSL